MRWQGRLSISVTLATAIGLLVAVSVSVVLAIGLWSAQRNTVALLSQTAQMAMNSAAQRVRQHLRPAEDQARYIQRLVKDGIVDPKNGEALGRVLLGLLAATPQIEAVLFVRPDLSAARAARLNGKPVFDTADLSGDAVMRRVYADASKRTGTYWGEPAWHSEYGKTYLNMRRPVRVGGRLIGVFVAAVSIEDLGDYLDRLGFDDRANLFLLYERTYVLAHPLLASGYPGRSVTRPLPAVTRFGDPVLSSIWQTENRHDLRLNLTEGTRGHVLRIFNDEYVFLYRSLEGYAAKPIIVGSYFRARDVDDELQRIIWDLVAGLVALLVSLAAAIFVGHRIARPIKRLSREAARIGDLEIARVQDLPGSVFKELDQQSVSFNAMLKALRWFELYVPKKLVERLIRPGGAGAPASDQRDLTVMFTDIAGFSGRSEGMAAADVAAFLNDHFALAAGCIEAAGGTVDKFIGDSVMAFWGAPDRQRNRAARACRAAREIARAVGEDNRARAARGEAPVRMRIGIHSGPVTVGNIGAPGRINYTIVGDTVNVAQRLEQLGKTILDDSRDVAVLVSEETVRQAGGKVTATSLGRHRLPGRGAPLEVFVLD